MRGWIALAMSACLSVAPASAEPASPVSCADFKPRLTSAVAKLLPERPALTYGRPDRRELEPIAGGAGIEAAIRCQDGSLAYVELRQRPANSDESLKSFLAFAFASLVAIDPGLGDREAAGLIETLRTDATGKGYDAETAFGPYQMIYRVPRGTSGEALTIGVHHN